MATSVRKSLLISFGQTYVLLVLQFVTSLVIARLLTPAELGVFSIAAVLIGIGHTLRDLGVVEYVIQEKELTQARLRSALMMVFIAAWSVGGIAWFASGFVADFYGVADLEKIMRILGVNFFLLPFGSVVMAHMRREMQFGRIAAIQVTASVLQAVLSITLAWWGYSYFSMAYAAVAGTATSILLVLLLRPRGFPFLPSIGELRRVFGFGSFSSARALLQDFDKGAPDLILGRLMNMEAVGYFGRAAGLVDLFNRLVVQATSYVALPHLSAKVRAGEDVNQPYLRAVTYMTGLAWPFYAFLALFAGLIVPMLYGPQWHPAIPLVQFICLGEMLLAPFYLQGQLAISTGHVRWEVVRVLASLLLKLLPLFLLPDYGLPAVAAGYAATSLIVAPLSYLILRKLFDIRLSSLLNTCWRSFGVFLVTLVILAISHRVILQTELTPTLKFIAAFLSFFTGWIVAIHFLDHPLRQEISKVIKRKRGMQA